MDRGACQAIAQGVTRVGHDLVNSTTTRTWKQHKSLLTDVGRGSKELTLGAALIDSQGSIRGHSSLSRHPSGIYYPS